MANPGRKVVRGAAGGPLILPAVTVSPWWGDGSDVSRRASRGGLMGGQIGAEALGRLNFGACWGKIGDADCLNESPVPGALHAHSR